MRNPNWKSALIGISAQVEISVQIEISAQIEISVHIGVIVQISVQIGISGHEGISVQIGVSAHIGISAQWRKSQTVNCYRSRKPNHIVSALSLAWPCLSLKAILDVCKFCPDVCFCPLPLFSLKPTLARRSDFCFCPLPLFGWNFILARVLRTYLLWPITTT